MTLPYRPYGIRKLNDNLHLQIRKIPAAFSSGRDSAFYFTFLPSLAMRAAPRAPA